MTITEGDRPEIVTVDWGTIAISGNNVTEAGEGSAEVVVSDQQDTVTLVSVTNEANWAVGTFALSKDVKGAQADNPAVPESVTVTATWQQKDDTEPSSKEITLPTDGTPVDLGEQLLIGTQVTLSETPLVDGSGIAWGAPGWTGTGVSQGDNNTAIVTIGRDADAHVDLENHAATSTAGISLLKVLTGESVSDVPDDAEFPVTATWTDSKDETQAVDLLINTNTPTSLGGDLPAGTVVTITEGASPAISAVDWGTITISGNNVTDAGNGAAEVVVSDQQDTVTLVSVTNEANWADGTFALAKHVDGVLLDDTEVPDTVDVVATWHEAERDAPVERSETITVPTDGSTIDFGKNLPAFTEVTLSEVLPEGTDRFIWGIPSWVGDEYLVVHEDGTATLTIQPAGDHELTLTNTAEAILGSVQVSKKVSGSGANAVPQNTKFTVTAEWTDLLGEKQSREITVSPAKPAMIEGLPFGTEVKLTENVTKNPRGARWVSAKWSSLDERVELNLDGRAVTVITIGNTGEPVALVLENEYTEGGLPITGAEFTGVLTVGIALLGLGGAALVVRHRRKQA